MINSNYNTVEGVVRSGKTVFIDPGTSRVLLWVKSKSYLSNTLVVNNGYLFVAKQPVPANIDIINDEYWAAVTWPYITLKNSIDQLSLEFDNHSAQYASDKLTTEQRLEAINNLIKSLQDNKVDYIKNIQLVVDDTYKLKINAYNSYNELIAQSNIVDLPIESLVTEVSYDDTNKDLIITLQNGNTLNVPLNNIVSGLATTSQLQNKLDKVTSVRAARQVYCTAYNSLETQMLIVDNGRAANNAIPMYYSADNEFLTNDGKGVLTTGTPKLPCHATPKKWVEDYVNTGLDGKLSLPTESDLANGGTNRLAGIQSNGTTQIWFRTNPLYIYPTTHNTQNTVIPAYKQAGVPFANKETGGTEALDVLKNTIFVAEPILDYEAANKKFVVNGLDGKVTSSPNATGRYVYARDAGKDTTFGSLGLQTSNRNNIANFIPYYYVVDNIGQLYTGTPTRDYSCANKIWVEDNFTVYKHLVSVNDTESGFFYGNCYIYSTQSTVFESGTDLPSGMYPFGSDNSKGIMTVGESGIINITYFYREDRFEYYSVNLIPEETFLSDIVTAI